MDGRTNKRYCREIVMNKLYDIKSADMPLAYDVPLDNPLEIYKVCKRMEITCKYKNGIGLSAVQVGIPWKLFIIQGMNSRNPLVKQGTTSYFVNCEYEGITDEGRVVSSEGCLSIRSDEGQLRLFRVERFRTIRLYGLQLIEENNKLKLDKIDINIKLEEDSVVFQHEIDHNFGKLISDSNIGKEIFMY